MSDKIKAGSRVVARGRRATVTSVDGDRVRVVYDAVGRKRSVTDYLPGTVGRDEIEREG